MRASEPWRSLGWRHPVWDLVRYYCSLRGKNRREGWYRNVRDTGVMSIGNSENVILEESHVNLLMEYLDVRQKEFVEAFSLLRTEEEALEFCRTKSIIVGKTATQSADHHQSSNALVAAVTAIATGICRDAAVDIEPSPQTRCVWRAGNSLHVTARNVDGAVPNLVNPRIVWETKEYWGKTAGGSKMSDAVYECHLVGRELREFEERTDARVIHVVFVDGKEQWGVRTSDLARFLDLMNQGFINYLFVGREVETNWGPTLTKLLE